ncbi:MAG: 16S rRNA (uracil(1498)-N(3))-methyltransferase [Pseudomonadota bacterium]
MALSSNSAPRLFVTADLPGPVSFSPGQVNYLRNVLRLSPGAAVTLFNGRDGEWAASITALSKKAGAALPQKAVRAQTPAPTLTLAFAPLKQARLDYMVEKAAEMGAGHLAPVLTQHGQVRRLNLERLTANMVEACEQCGILTVPTIAAPVPLAHVIAGTPAESLVIADEVLSNRRGDALDALRDATPPLTLLIGPEGGFSEAERNLFAPLARRVSLGPRVLRADTAAVALMALAECAHPSVA